MSEYGKLNGIPIDPDPSMPAGQKRWEIVPEGTIESRDMQYTIEGFVWHQNKCCFNKTVDGFHAVLAFRRPTALKEAGAGSLDLSPMIAIGAEMQGIGIGGMVDEKPRPMFAGNTRALVDKITALQSELTHLRTLAKDQGEALKAAKQTLNVIPHEKLLALAEWLDKIDDERGVVGREVQGDLRQMANLSFETLTLIAKVKAEVGE